MEFHAQPISAWQQMRTILRGTYTVLTSVECDEIVTVYAICSELTAIAIIFRTTLRS